MKFIDDEHKQFYEQKIKEVEKTDVYRNALIYTLGICPVTREHLDNIFKTKDGEININALQEPYQTGTSEKVTRLAFNLWNSCNYDREEDIEDNKVSIYYNPSEIFSCNYAPYFWEAIKIRYPEYTAKKDTFENSIEDVIKLVRSKYSNTISILLYDDILTLEYLYNFRDDIDCFQTIQLKEFDNRLSIEFFTQHITKVIDIADLEDIFEMLNRKSKQKEHTLDEIKTIKQKYVVGIKIKLIKMYDLYPISTGTIGTVINVNDKGQIEVNWENGNTSVLNIGVDEFVIYSE